MKIAVITDDGTTISQHFGRAPYYAVFTVEDGAIVAREMRDKLGHVQFQAESQAGGDSHNEHEHGHENGHDHEHEQGQGHGYGPAAQGRHARMAASIADCSVVLCRGMGRGAYESMQEVGITPIVTDIAVIDAAVQAYLDGSIEDHTDRLH